MVSPEKRILVRRLPPAIASRRESLISIGLAMFVGWRVEMSLHFTQRAMPFIFTFCLFVVTGGHSMAANTVEGITLDSQQSGSLSGRIKYVDGWEFSLTGKWTVKDNNTSHYFSSLPHGFHVTSLVARSIRHTEDRSFLMERDRYSIYLSHKGGLVYEFTSKPIIENGEDVKLMHGYVRFIDLIGVYKVLIFTTTVRNGKEAQIFRRIVLSARNR